LLARTAFTASKSACSQVAASPGGGGEAETVTVTCLVTVPLALVADNVYVVVEAGEQGVFPETATAPIPGAMEADVAPLVFQLSVELSPELMLEGLAVKLFITGGEGGGGEAETVTVTCLVTLPAALVAVNVKVVVEAGEPVALPEVATAPTPGAIETDVAPVVLQPSVVLPPELMLDGVAVKLLITGNEGGGAAETVTVACPVTLPTALVAVSV
jgi:hypothetical protein